MGCALRTRVTRNKERLYSADLQRGWDNNQHSRDIETNSGVRHPMFNICKELFKCPSNSMI